MGSPWQTLVQANGLQGMQSRKKKGGRQGGAGGTAAMRQSTGGTRVPAAAALHLCSVLVRPPRPNRTGTTAGQTQRVAWVGQGDHQAQVFQV